MISSQQQLEQAALSYGMLPFFCNPIHGFSVQEMAAPGMLFGGTGDEPGCWEWKGPVIQELTTAYGKFFRSKAGFVSVELLPHFLNYRRFKYPVKPDSVDQAILDLIRMNEGMTSTDLRQTLFGNTSRRRTPGSLVDTLETSTRPKRHSLEAPLQRLQMGGHLLIADFEYKRSSRGERYGWGVAVYSTPEIWFERNFTIAGVSPTESFQLLVDHLQRKLPDVDTRLIENLLR